MAVTIGDVIKLIFAVILPPLAVFLDSGINKDFWIDVLLTILGHIPGVIYAFYVLLSGGGKAKVI